MRQRPGADVFDDRATRELQLGPEGPRGRGDDGFGAPEATVRVVIGDDGDGGGPRRARPPAGRRWRAALVGSICTLLLCAGGGWALWRWKAGGEEYRTPPVDTAPRIVSTEVQLALESLLRDLYRDLRLDAEEEARLRAFRELHRLAPAEVAAFEQDLLERLASAAEHLRLGRWWVERSAFAEAEREYRRATEVDPVDPLAWAQLGAVLVGLARSEEALGCYQRALELDPRCWLAHYNLAVWHARRGEVEQALARAEVALTSLPAQAAVERRAIVQGLLEEPALASVREDPRFERLLDSASLAYGEGRR